MTQETKAKTSSAKSTESAGKIRTVVKRMYQQAQQAKEEKRKVHHTTDPMRDGWLMRAARQCTAPSPSPPE